MIVEREIKEQLLSIPIFNCLQLVCLYGNLFIPISRVLRRSLTIYLYHLNIYRDSLPKLPRPAPVLAS